MAVKPIPEGYHTVTPYLIVRDAKAVLDFMQRAFNGQVIFAMEGPGNSIVHAEVRIGDSVVMLAEGCEGYPPMPAMLHLYVEDVDRVFHQALYAGGIAASNPTNQFYGDRSAAVLDPSGNRWHIATHVEDVSPEEMKKRQEKFFSAAK